MKGPLGRLRTARQQRRERWLYRDDVVRMDAEGIVIRHYYWPLGHKRIAYGDISSFNARALKPWHGQHRVHGIDLRSRWYSRDSHRGEKELAIDLEVGGVIRPVLTPQDPDSVVELLQEHLDETGPIEPSRNVEPPAEESPESWLL